MKKLIYIMAGAVAVAALASCEGTGGSDNPTGAYTLVADKTAIDADGKDFVTFHLYDPDGEDLTASNQRNYIIIEEVNSGSELGSDLTFSTIRNGTFRFKAYYKNYESDNEVEVTGQNRGEYEKYYKKVGIYDLTNVMCGPCHNLAANFEALPADWKEHVSIFAIHTQFNNWEDPYIISAGARLYSEYRASGLPLAIYNLNEVVPGQISTSDIVGHIEDQLRDFPSTCGVAIKSAEYDEAANTVTISASVTSVVDGQYDLGYALLADNQQYVLYGTDVYTFHDVVYALSENYSGMTEPADLTADQEHSETYTFEFGDAEIPSSFLENTRVVVFAIRPYDGDVIIDNLAECKLGESVEYLLNE